MLRKKKFLIGGIVVLLAMTFLGIVGFQRSATYYYTVSELLSQQDLTHAGTVKVNGLVAPGSVETTGVRTLKFTLTEGGQSLPVVYQGAVPDTFKAGIEVVVEGRVSPAGGGFQASSIMTKCPSKYEPQ